MPVRSSSGRLSRKPKGSYVLWNVAVETKMAKDIYIYVICTVIEHFSLGYGFGDVL